MSSRILIVLCVLLLIVTSTSGAPFWVEWQAPESNLDGETVEVSNGTVRLNATIRGSVDYVEIEREYKDQQTDDRDIFRVENLKNQTIHAGTKNVTQVRVRAFGKSRGIDVTEFELIVNDATAPTLREFDTTRIDNTTIAVEGVVYDATQPHFVRFQASPGQEILNVRRLDNGRQTLGGFNIRRTSAEFERTLTIPRTQKNLTITLEDRADNTRTVTVPINKTTSVTTPTPSTTPTASTSTDTSPTTTTLTATPAATTMIGESQTSTPTSASTPSGETNPIRLGLNALLLITVIVGIGVLLR
ncbi:MAG: hypothetical protein J07HQW2_03080 [Haloquadratum walsbyi J07HQW2]|uniref:Uncharacterized protein n=1 Tax=Haloquadratum walsbyi J07HQW2 TaxID=1238425 RepID=U1NHE5_9EURY|nr:MAG: hypothetical protein J07HQW2_03080 [Haloquadratum walsbyi J07HQW2]